MRDYKSLSDAVEASKPPPEIVQPAYRYTSVAIGGDDATAPPQEAPDIDWLDYTSKAMDATHIDLSELGGRDFEAAEGYDGTSEENVSLIPQSFDQDQMEDVMKAESPEERDYLMDEFSSHNELMMELQAGGLPGLGVQLATAMFDPTALAAIVATEGMAAPWIMAAKTTRMATITSRMLKSGTVAAGTEAGLSAARLSSDVNYDVDDAMLDVMLAGTFGTALGWMARPTRDFVETHSVEKVTDNALPESARSAGAKEVEDVPELAAQKYRIDSLATLAKMENNTATTLGKELFEDAVVDQGRRVKDPVTGKTVREKKGVAKHTAALQAHMDRKHFTTQFNKETEGALGEWMKEQGYGLGKRIKNPIDTFKKQKEFSSLMFRQIELGDVDNPHVTKAVAAMKKQTDELFARARDAGLKGFDEEGFKGSYARHKWNFTKLTSMDDDNAVELIYEGLKGGGRKSGKYGEVEDVGAYEAYLKAMAIGFNRRARNVQFADQVDFDDVLVGNVDTAMFLRESLTIDDIKRVFSEEDAAKLKGATKEEKLDAAVKKILASAFKTKGDKGQAGAIDRGKKRMDLDLSVRNANGDSLVDLFDNDAIGLHQGYIREMTGWISLAKNVKSRSIRGKDDWNKMLNDIKREEAEKLAASGSSKSVDESFNKIKTHLERGKRELFGENTFDVDDNTFNRSLNLARRYNFTTSMGMAAFSAMSEMGRVFAEGGLKNAYRNIPELKKIMQASFSQGKGKTLAAEVNTFGSSFGDEHLITALHGFNGDDVVSLDGLSKWDKADIVSQNVQRTMAQVSLLAPVDRALRQFSFSTRYTAIFRHFKDGEKLKFDPKDLGWDDADMESFKTAMLAHSKQGKLGGVEKTGIEQWEPSVRHKFLMGMTRADAKAVQQMIAGQSPQWLDHPLARVFMQFRTFVLNSYTKHFLADTNAILMGDWNTKSTALVSIGMSAILASIGYKTRVEAAALGREDGDQYKKRLLEDDNALLKNTINYMPIAGSMTTGWNMSVGSIKPDWSMDVFRSTGGSHKGFASFALGDKADRLAALGREAVDGEDSRHGSSVVRKLAPFTVFGNTLPGTLAINTLDKYAKD